MLETFSINFWPGRSQLLLIRVACHEKKPFSLIFAGAWILLAILSHKDHRTQTARFAGIKSVELPNGLTAKFDVMHTFLSNFMDTFYFEYLRGPKPDLRDCVVTLCCSLCCEEQRNARYPLHVSRADASAQADRTSLLHVISVCLITGLGSL